MKKTLLSIFFAGFFLNAYSQAYTEWLGANGNNWSNSQNWNVPLSYSQLEWKGLGNAVSNNDIDPLGYNAWRLYFNGTKQYTISGSAISLYDYSSLPSWVLSDSQTTQNLNASIRFVDTNARPSFISTRSTGSLNFSDVFLGGSVTELRFSSENNLGIITVGGILSGASDKIIAIGLSDNGQDRPNTTVILNGQNTYSGSFSVKSGILHLNHAGGNTLPTTSTITLNSGSTLRVSSNQTLANVTLNGGTITVDNGIELTIANLSIISSSVISNSGNILITGNLQVSSGNLETNGVVKLISNASGTARLAPVAGSITGEVEVQRYIPQGKRAFRFLASPVTTASTIANSWQSATHITGSASGANGFDATETGNSSLFVYNNTAASGSGWSGILNTNNTILNAGQGYRMLVRGDRNVDLNQSSATNMNAPVTLKVKGILKTGQVTFDANSSPAINATSNTTTNGFSLIGNPYASPVDWNSLAKSGLTDTYYAWDPNMGTSLQRGRYVAYSTSTGFNNLGNTGASSVNRYIQSGQAFFVKNSILGTAGSLTFTETSKASSVTNIFRATNETQNAVLNIAAYETSEVALGFPIDGTIAVFGPDFQNEFGAGDVEKLYGSGEHIALSRNNVLMAIEALAPAQTNDILFLKTLQFLANKSYTLKIDANNFSGVSNAFLVDHYLNTEIPINLSDQNFYNYTTTSDAESISANRFTIVFESTLGTSQFNSSTVSVYPNPIRDNQFNIALPLNSSGKVNIRIFNMIGQQIYKTSADVQSLITIKPNTQLQTGIYILEIENEGRIVQQKIAVK